MVQTTRRRAGEICEITSSKRIFAHDYQETGVPFFRGKEITERFNGKLEVSTELFISREKFEDIKRKHGAPKAGDLLLTSVGTLGSVYVVRPEDEFYFKDGNLTWFRNLQGADSKFLYYWLQSPAGRAELRKCTIGSSQPALTIVLLKEMEIDLPPLAEQRRIADILSAYDDLIENCQRRIRILEEMARRLYREWFVHFRYPGHESIPLVDSPLGPVPQGWEVKDLREVADVNRKQINAKTAPAELNYIDIASVSPGKIDEITTYAFDDAPGRARRVVQNGDVIWSTVRPNRRSYALVLNPVENTIASTGFAVLTAKAIPFAYLYLATTTDEFVSYLTNHATGVAYPAVTGATFECAPVLVPSPQILERFAAAATPMFEKSNVLLRQAANLRRTRDLLLPSLLDFGASRGCL